MSGFMQVLAAAKGLLGPDLVVNGTFSAGTDWTDSGASWTITGGKAVYSGVASDFTNTGGTAPSAGRTYRVIFTVSNYVSGDVYVYFGGQNGSTRSANGTYSQDISTSGTDKLTFVSGGLGDFSIDNVSAQEVLP